MLWGRLVPAREACRSLQVRYDCGALEGLSVAEGQRSTAVRLLVNQEGFALSLESGFQAAQTPGEGEER